MAYEIGILADLQVAEALASHENITLACDATTIEGSHINEVHISAAGKTLALDVQGCHSFFKRILKINSQILPILKINPQNFTNPETKI